MREPIDRDVVREIVREYHPDADVAEVEYISRRAIGEAEIALYDRIRLGIPTGLRAPARDAEAGRK